jgi:hypothetical protein
VVDGRQLLFSEMYALPILSYEDELEERDEFYRRTLEIVTANSGTLRVGFASVSERDAAVEIICKLEPRLK